MCDLETSGRLSAYHDGELPAGERAAVERHLAECAACREALEQMRRLSAALAGFEAPALGAGAMERMRGAASAAT